LVRTTAERIPRLTPGGHVQLRRISQMHARRSKVVAVLTAAVVLLVALATGAQAQPKAAGAQAATIKVGIIYSRTGLLGAYGAEYLSGLRWGRSYATGGTGKVNGNDVA